MVVTATEFKLNFGRYLKLVQEEDIYLTKNGKTIAKISNPNVSAVDTLTGILKGMIPDSFDRKDIRMERLNKYAIDD